MIIAEMQPPVSLSGRNILVWGQNLDYFQELVPVFNVYCAVKLPYIAEYLPYHEHSLQSPYDIFLIF